MMMRSLQILILFGFCFSSPLMANLFKIEKANAILVKQQYVVNATIQYQFTEKALEALKNGVPLTLNIRLYLQKSDAWFWKPNLIERTFRYQLRFHPLTETYQVWDLAASDKQSFETLDAAKDLLGEMMNLPLAQENKLQKGTQYKLSIKAFLDIEALPLPLRPLAYISSAWDMESDWFSFTLIP